MKKAKTAWNTLQAFCCAWFERRCAKEVCTYLADEICFVGTGENEFAHNPQEMREYLKRDIQEIPEPFSIELTLFQDQEIDEDTHNLSVGILLKNTQYRWRLRGFFTMVRLQENWRLRTLWFAEPGYSQRDEEHYPRALVMENIARQRQKLLNDSLPGGMMGGYIQKGFPFYFINSRMLEYLGYSGEGEFVTDIRGMISNCMHPDDRDGVDRTVMHQIEEWGEYAVEYRMKKRDGSYIWVHDLGRKVTAENGKPAIISVCIDITAQKKAQTEIMHLYNNVPGAVFRVRYDDEFTVADANDGLYELLGYSREEFIALGNQMTAVVYPDDLNAVRQKLMADEDRGNTIRDEHRLVCRDGNVKWVSLKAQLMSGDDGETYFYGFLVDITDEKLSMERIRELYEKELAYFAQKSSAEGSIQGRVNVTQNLVENYQSIEAAAIAQTGDTYEQAIRRLADSAADAGYGEYLCTVLSRSNVLASFSSGKTDLNFEFLRKRKDGDVFWSKTNFRFHQNPESGDVIAFFYTNDITEQKIQEQLLNKVTELDYEIIFDIDIRSDTYHLVSFHPDTLDMMPDRGQFQAEARAIASAYMDDTAGRQFLAKLDFTYMQQELAHHGSYHFIAKVRDEHGNFHVKRYQVFYISQELERVCIARTDVTDIIRQEQQQREALTAALSAAEQANAAKTDFLSRMSHEIRTPMNAIIGMSTIAEQAIGNDEQVAECISKIKISSRFLLSLINDILNMSRIESGKMLLKSEKIHTEDFLNDLNAICYSQAVSKGVNYECILNSTLDGFYIGDTMKLQQVLLNILTNAIKFTDKGGKVTFTVKLHRKTTNGVELRFIIHDNGIGISEDFLRHMFQPFSQESMGTTALYGGTGLGLSISKNIVDMMGGKISARSIKGIGSEFIVDVPLGITPHSNVQMTSKPPDKKEETEEHNIPVFFDFSGHRILLAEDNEINTEVAMILLESKGFAVDTAENGLRAVEMFRKSESGYYDAILMDIRMPLMDGLTAAGNIRHMNHANSKTIPIIAMTANAFDDDIEKSKAAGMNAHLTKPIEPEILFQVLYDFILNRENT